MFTQKELHLRQKRWLELLKDYDMSVLYNPRKDNVVEYDLSRMSIPSVAHVSDGKKELLKELHKFSWLVIRLEDSPNRGSMDIVIPNHL